MNRKWIVVMLAVTLFATAAFAFGGGRRGGHGKPGFGFFGAKSFAELEARLKLTPEQSTQLQNIAKQHREQMKAERQAAGADARQELMRQIFSNNPNQGEINRLVSEIKQRQAEQLDSMVAAGAQANKVLTAEQRTELHQMLEEKATVRKNMRERMKQKREQGQEGSKQ